MATNNLLDLSDNDTEDPSLHIAAVEQQKLEKPWKAPASTHTQAQPAKVARLPTKPTPLAQAVREAKNEPGRGGGRGVGRGRGHGHGGNGFNHDSNISDNSNEFLRGYRPSEEGEDETNKLKSMAMVVLVLMMENLEQRDSYRPIQRKEQKREMAPRKRRATDRDKEQAKAPGQEILNRVARSMKRQTDGNPSELTQPNKKVAKSKAAPKVLTVADDGSHNKNVLVKHCKHCNSFKTRAFQIRSGLEKGVPCINVLLNLEKPRKSCFKTRDVHKSAGHEPTI